MNTTSLTCRSFVSVVASLVVGGVLVSTNASDAQVVAPKVATQTAQIPSKPTGTPHQQVWLKSTVNERVKIAEKLGDEGARVFAQAKGWIPVFDGTARGVVQGPDQVYQEANGSVHVIEAKGGSGQLGHAYGFAQGSSEWAVESANRVLRNPAASEAERHGAALVLRAAAEGKLQVHVVRTPHVLGEPAVPILEQTVKSTDKAAQLAVSALDDLGRNTTKIVDGLAATSEGVAQSTGKAGTAVRTTTKIVVPVAVAIDGGLRIHDGLQIEHQFQAGEISEQEREVAHAKNAGGMAGGWGGAAGGAWIAGEVAAPFAAGSGPGAPWIEGAAAVGGGIVGYKAGEEAAEAAVGYVVQSLHSTGRTIAGAVDSAMAWTADTAVAAAEGVAAAWA